LNLIFNNTKSSW